MRAMTTSGAHEPVCEDHPSEAIALVIRGRARDLGGGFFVRRALPAMARRLVGPFIFFDQMGPTEVPAGAGMDVRPHPHVALATITYLFEGEVFHRDSLGTATAIRPGEVNWMIAGRGIVHSERTAPAERARPHRLHGIQAWVALRKEEEEREPAFFHYDAHELPVVTGAGTEVRLIAGSGFGQRAPSVVSGDTFYADAKIARGAALDFDCDHEERAFYVAIGEVRCEGSHFDAGAMVVLRKGARATLEAVEDARVMLLGGAAMDGPRHIWWNFVASTPERIERAKADWRDGRFPKVPGDEVDFIPLPEV